MFADDTNLFHSYSDIKTLFQIVSKELTNINKWFQANKLSLNAKKTQLNIPFSVNSELVIIYL